MLRTNLSTGRILALLILGMLAGQPALADKPDHAGGGKPDKQEKDKGNNGKHEGRGESSSEGSDSPVVSVRFDERQRTSVQTYYSEQIRSGHCPPGLAKKNNGCMPPGQAKKWAIGQQLPPDVVYVDLSPEIVIVLGPPPELHKYVRVASDILLIAVGTSMVVDAIEDLSKL